MTRSDRWVRPVWRNLGIAAVRWHQLFGGTILSERYLREDELLEVEETQLEGLVEIWRERLKSVSWLLTHRAA